MFPAVDNILVSEPSFVPRMVGPVASDGVRIFTPLELFASMLKNPTDANDKQKKAS